MVLDRMVLEDEEEQLMIRCFGDGCKDVVVLRSGRRGQSSGFVEERDGRAKQEATSHVIIRVGGSSFSW